MELQNLYPNEKHEAVIKCINCRKKKSVNVSQYKENINRPIKVKCPCGAEFIVSINNQNRRHPRAIVNISGDYSVLTSNEKPGEMVIKNLSRKGVGFVTRSENTLKVEDIVEISLMKEDQRWNLGGSWDSPLIKKIVVVRHVKGNFVGASFCDNDIGKALSAYIRPAINN